MRFLIGTAIALTLATATVRAGTPAPGFTDTLVVGGLAGPTAIAFMPDGRMLVAQKTGALLLVDGGVASLLTTIPVCSGSEMGLLGIALDPDFGTNGFIYLYRTEDTGGCAGAAGRSNEVVRVTMDPGDTISLASLTVLLTGIRTDNGNHDGGVLRIGPDMKLYVGAGDTGLGDNAGCPGSATNPYSQDVAALEGKILRLNLDGTIPGDNPFVGVVGAREEIFATGFRNPFRMDFDPISGDLWVGDVGDLAFEEIDIVTSGANYGWPQCEADFPGGCALGGEVSPIFTYSHGGGCPGEGALSSLGTSITGGTFAGAAFGASADSYVFGDFTGSAVYLAQPTLPRDDITTPATIVTSAGGPVDFARGPDGAVYYVAIFTGQVRRVAADLTATDEELLGTKLVVSSVTNPTKQRLTVTSKDLTLSLGAGNGTADDPVSNGGTLTIAAPAGCTGGACAISIPLPQGVPGVQEWKYVSAAGLNKGYKYKGTDGTGVTTVSIKTGKLLKVKVTGALGFDLAADPDPIALRLDTGGRAYCLEFGGTQTYVPGVSFKAEAANPPVACIP